MIIFNGIHKLNRPLGPVAATIGNFDGIHLGHQKIIEKVIQKGKEMQIKKVLITFDPHPARVIMPSKAPKLINNRHQKIKILEGLGIDILLFVPFDRDLSLMTAEEFLNEIMKKIDLSVIYIGENFRFGRNRSADCKTLAALGERLGFKVGCVPFIRADEKIVSSSLIREMVKTGQVEEVSLQLGRPYSIEGKVVPGEGRGRMMNIPTANIQPYNELIPERGIYISEMVVAGSKYESVTNIGIRPTFDLSHQTIETHIMDFQNHIYGERVELFIHKKIRDEVKFESAEKLSERIQKDIEEMKTFFKEKKDSLLKK
jgi:riboflavin kinase/FMN adenylyltransferase